MPNKEGPDMVLVSLHMPKVIVEALDELVRHGIVPNRSEAIRQAVNEYLVKYLCAFTRLNSRARPWEEVQEEKAFLSMLIKGR